MNGNQGKKAADEMQQQIDQNNAELESKRQSLYRTRIGIIKGQGGESWTPDRTSPEM